MELMNRRAFLQWAAAAGTLAEGRAAYGQPNIVYILADDLGYGDVGYLNPQSKIPTPNIDRLAAQGVRFTDAHDPTAVCTPTRYGILTGRYCWRSRLQRGVLPPWGETLIEPGRLTVPALLKTHGYSTAAIGKWHLGWRWPTIDGQPPAFKDGKCNVDFSKAIADGPTTRGFDYYFGTDVPNYPPYCFIENRRTIGVPTDILPLKKLLSEKGTGFGPLDCRPGPMLPGWELVKILPALADKAVQYIEGQAKKSPRTPFFLYFPLTGPHTPIVPAPRFQGNSKAGPYGDWVFQIDWTVGQVLDALDRSGLAKDTLVVFTSDNGPENFAYARAREYRHYSMGNLRGVKRDVWEGGHRVPFLARWPGRIRAGTASNEIICQTDLMATLAAMLGTKLPENAGEDSYNILPALLGEKLANPIREATVMHSAKGNFAIRQGSWVLIDHPTGDDNKEPEWFKEERHYESHNFPGELYDLREDLPERKNLYGEHPEIVQKLKALLEKYKREGRSRS
jgi:arylsulfatase A